MFRREIHDAVRLGALLLVSACGFTSAPPDGALVLCRGDAECPPSMRCHPVRNACVDEEDPLDVEGPVVVAARFEPAFARDGDQVILSIEADEPVSEVAFLFAGGVSDPGFALLASDADDERTFTLTVDASVPEGTYDLALVSLSDPSGNAARSFPDATLVIDRSPPTLRNVEVSGGPFSDLPGQNIAPVVVDASEPLELLATLGDRAVDCVERPESALGYVCEVPLDAAQDGANVGLVRGVDAAGNEASASFSVDVDVDAPRVVPGTLTFLARGPSGVERRNSTVRAGDRLELSFVVDEALGAAPAAELFTGARTPFVIEAENAQVFSLATTVPPDTLAGTHPVSLQLEDVAGHVSVQEITSVEVAAVVPPSCPLVVEGELRCTDNDGDGHFGRPIDCPECPCAEDDCDDSDPTTNPTALERFVDTVVNSCADSAPSLPLFHVDTARAEDGDGSAAAPFNSLAFALQIEGDGIILLASGSHGIGGERISKSIYGGYAADFASQNGRSTIQGPTVDIVEPVIVESIEILGELSVFAPSTLIDVRTHQSLLVNATVRVIDSQLDGDVELSAEAGASRFINVDAAELTSRADTHFIGGALAELDVDGGRTIVVNSVIAGISEPLIDVAGGELQIVHSVINSDSGIVLRLNRDDGLDIYGSLIRTEPPNATLFCLEINGDGVDCNGTIGDGGPLNASLTDVVLDRFVSGLWFNSTDLQVANTDSIFDLGATLSLSNVEAGQNLTQLQADGLHITAQTAGQNSVSFDDNVIDIPASASIDVDGDCRTGLGHDIGADER